MPALPSVPAHCLEGVAADVRAVRGCDAGLLNSCGIGEPIPYHLLYFFEKPGPERFSTGGDARSAGGMTVLVS